MVAYGGLGCFRLLLIMTFILYYLLSVLPLGCFWFALCAYGTTKCTVCQHFFFLK